MWTASTGEPWGENVPDLLRVDPARDAVDPEDLPGWEP